eukprot:7377651-Prymnesium_polylepis.1
MASMPRAAPRRRGCLLSSCSCSSSAGGVGSGRRGGAYSLGLRIASRLKMLSPASKALGGL